MSPEILLGDVDGNIERVAVAIAAAAARGARLIVAPELALSGYVFTGVAEARAAALDRADPRFELLRAALPGGATAVVGYAESSPTGLFNTAVVFTRSAVLEHYRKSHLWGIEKAVFQPGDFAGAVVDTPVGSLGVAICYDNEFPEVPRRLALAGAEVLALPVNWPVVARPPGEHPPEVIQAMAAARSSRLPTVIADRRGQERGVTWTSGTVVIDGDGWIAARPDARATAVADLAVTGRDDKSLPPHNDLFRDRRPGLY
ncbi:nitrilase-related carbon-nitrogen hydrolase [Microbacterium oryzae]|nr:nitrilase-related carbon-nitrogen hydrolase [Microbacterium oryzae]